MISVLVTGGDGQLARALGKMRAVYPGLTLDIKARSALDITKAGEVSHTLGSKHYDYCINCAAFTAVDDAEKDSETAHAVNAEAVNILAQNCKKLGTTLIHISTDYVFNGEKEKGYKPDDIPNPINEYGRSKLAGEHYVRRILDRYFIIRTSWLYDQENRNFYTTILKKARQGEQLRVTDAQRGCPTHVNTVAEFILNLIARNSKEYGIHHVTDEEIMTWFEFAEKILKEHNLYESTTLVRDKNYRSFAKRPANSILISRGE